MKHLEYCILYSIHYTLYSIRCTIHYTVYIIQCTIHYTVYNAPYSMQCTLYICTIYTIQYTVYNMHGIHYIILCILYSVWIVRNACSILYNVHCINIQYTLYNTPTKLKTKYHANILCFLLILLRTIQNQLLYLDIS